ncbi:MAG: pyridoxamine 5'-phosphate oxidase family protein [Pseudomonadota bacterium]
MAELSDVEPEAWGLLEAATREAGHPFRTLSLATVGVEGHPQTRSLILRAVRRQARQLELHTDIRSAKWPELQTNPRVSLLGYDPEARLQLRFAGHARLFGPGTPKQEAQWEALSPWTRSTYCGGPPGDDLADGYTPAPRDTPPDEDETAFGQLRFGVIVIAVARMDWYRHRTGENLRAQFDYAGSRETSAWVNP